MYIPESHYSNLTNEYGVYSCKLNVDSVLIGLKVSPDD